MARNFSSIARRITGTVARIVRDVTEAPAVARELRQRRTAQSAKPAPLTADDITGTVPEVAEVEAAARLFEDAREQANTGSRLKRAAEKILKRTPDGVYGPVIVERFESARFVPDMEAVKALFKAHNLGDVPQKRCAPSMTITFAEETVVTEAAAVLAEVA